MSSPEPPPPDSSRGPVGSGASAGSAVGEGGCPPSERLTPTLQRALCELLERRAGYHFDERATALFERRLGPLAAAHGHATLHGYTEWLLATEDAAALAELAGRLMPKETYFFRQSYQLDCLCQEILPGLVEQGLVQGELRVWSAGCATGEEAYSVALALIESGWAERLTARVVGTDVSAACIATARNAVYGPHSFRAPLDDAQERAFEAVEGGLRVGRRARALCSFSQLDLLEPGAAPPVGVADVIFCRNVLIYLTDWARERVAATLAARLAVGGVLLLGHSESLIALPDSFERVSLERELVHRRVLTASERRGGGVES